MSHPYIVEVEQDQPNVLPCCHSHSLDDGNTKLV